MRLSLSALLLLQPAVAFVNSPSSRGPSRATFALSMIPMPLAVPSDLATVTTIASIPQQQKSIVTLPASAIMEGVREFLVPPAYAAGDKVKPPTQDEIKLLREALGAIYGERNPEKAADLLTKAISVWERQAPDERAALVRVRGDCYMELLNAQDAEKDYTTTIDLLTGPGGELADPGELPAARLGRGRALRSMGKITPEQFKQASDDYQISLRLSSREEWDTNEELEQDGVQRNPYAGWEWGMAQRGAGDYKKAAETHTLAAFAFKDIGDRARSVISELDAGIDLAATEDVKEAKTLLEGAIKKTTSVEGTDVELLQRVIAKEGEARLALASILWSNDEKAAAESQLGEACNRLEQLQADSDAREEKRRKTGAVPLVKVKKLPFTIDDTVGTECSCSRFKNEKFLSETLLWPTSLQEKVLKLTKIGK